MKWVITVIWECDGTQRETLVGEHASIQLHPAEPGQKGGLCIVQTYDADGRKMASFQSSVTYGVLRRRADADA